MSALPARTEPPGALGPYERVRYWLGEALEKVRRVDEAMSLRDEGEQLRLLGRQCNDKTLQANAVELMMRSERRLGELLIAAKAAGQIGRGAGFHHRRKGSGPEHLAGEVAPVRLEDVGIDRKLSMRAQALARSPLAIFEDVVRQSREKVLAGRAIVVNPVRDVGKREKQVRRAVREAQLAARQKALPGRRYGVIYADPEWRFETWSENGMDRAAENHYPTSDLQTIKARPVGTLAAPDCVLFLWATVPMLPQALEVMRAWGFAYRSHIVWDKLEPGTGYWSRNRHELLLVGTRGNVPAPAPGTQFPSVMASRAGAHSAKPDWAYELIEAYFTNLGKIELNARKTRPGWDRWGLEAPGSDDGAAWVAASVPMPPAAATSTGDSAMHRPNGGSDMVAAPRDAATQAATDDCSAADYQAPGDEEIRRDGTADVVEELAGSGATEAAGEVVPSTSPAAVHAAPDDELAGEEDVSPEALAALRARAAPILAAEAFATVASASSSGPGQSAGDPQGAYRALLARDARRGRHTRDTAKPILEAAYGAVPPVPVQQLADDLGHKLMTVLSWARRCGLTSRARTSQAAREMHSARRSGRTLEARP